MDDDAELAEALRLSMELTDGPRFEDITDTFEADLGGLAPLPLTTLKKLLTNVLDQPTEEKYRLLKRGAKSDGMRAIFASEKATRFLARLGFLDDPEGLKLPVLSTPGGRDQSAILRQGLQAVEEAQHPAPSVHVPPPPPQPAASQNAADGLTLHEVWQLQKMSDHLVGAIFPNDEPHEQLAVGLRVFDMSMGALGILIGWKHAGRKHHDCTVSRGVEPA